MSAQSNGTQSATAPSPSTTSSQDSGDSGASNAFIFTLDGLSLMFTASNQMQLRMARPSFFQLVVDPVLESLRPASPRVGVVTTASREFSDSERSEGETSRNGNYDPRNSSHGSDTARSHTSDNYASSNQTSNNQAFVNGGTVPGASANRGQPFIIEEPSPEFQAAPWALLRMELRRFEDLEGVEHIRRFYESFVERQGDVREVEVRYTLEIDNRFDGVTRQVVTTALNLPDDVQSQEA